MGRMFTKYFFADRDTGEWTHYKAGAFNGYGTAKTQDGFIDLIARRPSDRGVTQSPDEAYMLYSSVRDTARLEGAIAEVGVNRGGSAMVICKAKGDSPLFLCDTFEGMPNTKIDPHIDAWPTNVRTHTNTSVQSVAEYLGEYPNVHFVDGIFPESVDEHPEVDMAAQTFRVVHLDVDLYECTLDCLRWFWPRMVAGGRLISHNYNLSGGKWGNTPGVKQAFTEFFTGREHLIVEVAETQCLVVKP